MTLSIVMVNWKSVVYLEQCIESIRKDTCYDHEIIVIDNNSGPVEALKLKSLPIDELIINANNRGFAAANNQGFKLARGKFILMLNPDTHILDNAIDKMIDFLFDHKDVYAVGPKLYYSERFDYHPSVRKFPTPLSDSVGYLPLYRFFMKFIEKVFRIKFNNSKIQKVDYVWGAAILFKKTVFERIGYFDENFFVYSEEVDFFKRMALNGLNLYYFPEAEVIHYGGKSQHQSSILKHQLYWTSKMKYYEKYFSDYYVVINSFFFSLLIYFKIKILNHKELLPVFQILRKKLSGETFIENDMP